MTVCKIAYLNDRFIAAEEAQISPFDRGFLFAHAAYEVTAVYDGHLVDAERHFARLERTLAGLGIPSIGSDGELLSLHQELLRRNQLREGMVYLQVTAGAYCARDFAGPEALTASVFMFCAERQLIGDTAKNGIAAITLPDTRWQRRDLKTTQLLSQALAYRAAKDAGAQTAWMIEEGYVTEAASANAWIVNAEGQLITRDLSSSILAGITRAAVMDQLSTIGVHVEQRRFTREEALAASEAFTTSASTLIAPVISIDGHTIGSGAPGPVTRQIQKAYYRSMGADIDAISWLPPG